MKAKTFLESAYYNLREAHALNIFLNNLEDPTCTIALANEVIALLSVHQSYDKKSDYVPGSSKHNEIIVKEEAYAAAQATLKEFKYSKEHILEEYRLPRTLSLYKHSITFTERVTCWEYDYDRVECIEDEGVDVERNVFFYTKDYQDNLVLDPKELRISYMRDNRGYEPHDLITIALAEKKYLSRQVQIYELCYEKEWDPRVFTKIFPEDISFYSQSFGGTSMVKINETGEEIYTREIPKLMEEYLVAKPKRYILDDKYVDYPHTDYISFKKDMLNVTYMDCDQESQ